MSELLRVEGLSVRLDSDHDVISDIEFAVAPGEILGVVGESGSGKTTIAMALAGYARRGAHIAQGRIWYGEQDLLALSAAKQRELRGRVVAYVSQDSGTALNPALRLADQLYEVLLAHEPRLDEAARGERVARALERVGLPCDTPFLRRYPHQLSGGQQQRVLLALAFLLEPRVVVLDEPTTALDVTTQASVLKTVRAACQSLGAAAVYVSHDLAVVSELADRVLVLYGGRIAELATAARLFARPLHPYTRGLLAAVPEFGVGRRLTAIPGRPAAPAERPRGCSFAPRCSQRSPRCDERPPVLGEVEPNHYVACLLPSQELVTSASQSEAAPRPASTQSALLSVRGVSASYGSQQVLHDLHFELRHRECLALVGESGSGKTTLARALVGLGEALRGEIEFASAPLPLSGRERSKDLRRRIQYVFQNPYRSLNPRQDVASILRQGLDAFFDLDSSQTKRRVREVLERVSLPESYLHRFPSELSGGERQRVAIARALVCEPELLICDEVTSSLDVSVQAAILELIAGLKQAGLSILFVTHNLGVVRYIADRVGVLAQGRLVELGDASQILSTPQAQATRALLVHAPTGPTRALSVI